MCFWVTASMRASWSDERPTSSGMVAVVRTCSAETWPATARHASEKRAGDTREMPHRLLPSSVCANISAALRRGKLCQRETRRVSRPAAIRSGRAPHSSRLPEQAAGWRSLVLAGRPPSRARGKQPQIDVSLMPDAARRREFGFTARDFRLCAARLTKTKREPCQVAGMHNCDTDPTHIAMDDGDDADAGLNSAF